MKKVFLLCLVLCSVLFVAAQTDSLLKWTTQSKKIGNGLYELVSKTTIPVGWHVYGINQGQEIRPCEICSCL